MPYEEPRIIDTAKIADLNVSAVNVIPDAYYTAKPGEPVFTLQGGDELASYCVLEWARRARERAMAIMRREIDAPESEAQELLKRATAAEAIAWDMQAYFRGHKEEIQQAKLPEKVIDPSELDAWSTRINAARRVDNCVAELTDQVELLKKLGWLEHKCLAVLSDCASRLRAASEVIRPHRRAE
jgi:uncharacterized protein YhaN